MLGIGCAGRIDEQGMHREAGLSVVILEEDGISEGRRAGMKKKPLAEESGASGSRR
jgi:hypothetical protein